MEVFTGDKVIWACQEVIGMAVDPAGWTLQLYDLFRLFGLVRLGQKTSGCMGFNCFIMHYSRRGLVPSKDAGEFDCTKKTPCFLFFGGARLIASHVKGRSDKRSRSYDLFTRKVICVCGMPHWWYGQKCCLNCYTWLPGYSILRTRRLFSKIERNLDQQLSGLVTRSRNCFMCHQNIEG